MNKYIVFSLFFILIIMCREDGEYGEDKVTLETSSRLYLPNNTELYCDSACTSCEVWDRSTEPWTLIKTIDETSDSAIYYEYIFFECKKQIGIYPPDATFDWDDWQTRIFDLENGTVTGNMEYIRYLPPESGETYNIYGFDSWRECDASCERKNYLSIASGCSTSFKVDISLSDVVFERYMLKITENFNLSFNSSSLIDTFEVTTGTSIVPIYSLSSPHEGIADMQLIGVSKGGFQTVLAGEMYNDETDSLEEDVLKVVEYNEIEYPNKVYHQSGFGISSSTWKNEFNDVLRQGTAKIDSPEFIGINTSDWDLNNSGYFDIFVGAKLDSTLPDGFYDEFEAVIVNADEFYDCGDNISSSHFIIDAVVRLHSIIIEDPVPDADGLVRKFKLNTLYEVFITDTVSIGSFVDTSNHKKVIITGKNYDSSYIFVGLVEDTSQGLPDEYSMENYSTIYIEGIISGETRESCSFCMQNMSIYTYIHEFLHQQIVGDFYHTGFFGFPDREKDNIMYPTSERTGAKLKYREVPIYETTFTGPGTESYYKQWDQFND